MIFSAALVDVLSSFLLAPKFQATGIAMAAVITQTYTLVAFCVVLRKAHLNPFARTAGDELPVEFVA